MISLEGPTLKKKLTYSAHFLFLGNSVLTYIGNCLRSPSGRVCDESESEQNSGERLQRSTNGEHRAADAASTTDGLKTQRF